MLGVHLYIRFVSAKDKPKMTTRTGSQSAIVRALTAPRLSHVCRSMVTSLAKNRGTASYSDCSANEKYQSSKNAEIGRDGGRSTDYLGLLVGSSFIPLVEISVLNCNVRTGVCM
jgi:predicted alpha/beta superfamily hydrolase